MQAVNYASYAPSNRKRAFRGTKAEPEAIFKRMKSDGSDAGYLMSMAQEAKRPNRFLSIEEEQEIFGRYRRAAETAGKLREELKGLKNGAARSPKARRIEREIYRNRAIMRSVETIIIATHEGLIHMIAKRCMRIHKPRRLTEDDLVQEGKIALLRRGIPNFEPERGYHFSTYGSWWIKQAIERTIQNDENIIRMPVHKHTAAQQLNRFIRGYETKHGREPSEEEIRDETGIDPEKIAVPMVISIYRKDRMRDGKLWDILTELADVNADNPEKNGIRNDRKGIVENLMGILDAREQTVIRMRFGLDGRGEHTLEEVGQEFGVTRERIRQIEYKALGKMRHFSRRRYNAAQCGEE